MIKTKLKPRMYWWTSFLALVGCMILSGEVLSQTGSTISGVITDEQKEPLPGVTIIEKGTKNGAITDVNGRYVISVETENAVLVISYISFESQEISIGNRSEIDISLKADVKSLEEVIVVGYGTQIESQITGSIARADPEDMTRVSTPTVGQALQGRAAGVFIKNQNGQPGSNKTTISIRGFGEPLYIVDGLPVAPEVFSSLNPNDIEELNILKDAASAAVYGARAGNGVVLVTTKRGTSGGVKFSYRGDVGLQSLTMVPDAADTWEHMSLFNIRRIDRGEDLTFSPETIAAYKANQGLDPENYANVDMYQMISRKASPMITHDLSLQGGSDKVRYFISGNLFDQTGLEKNVFGETDTRFKRYTVRGNVDVNVTDKFDLNLDMSYNLQDFTGPRNQFEGTGWSQGQGIFARSGRWRPFYSIEELPGGHLNNPRGAPGGQTVNPLNLASADIGGTQEFERQFIDIKLGGKYQILPWLSTRAVLNYQTTNLQDKVFQKRAPEYRYNADTEEHEFVRALNADTRVLRRNSQTENINFQGFLNGNHKFGDKHSITGTYVFEFIQQDIEIFEASRINYEFQIAQLTAGPPNQQFNDDFIDRNKRMGHIGRFSYSYAERFSIEASARYDGSIKFPSGNRWGFFPSISGAWNITEESFLKNSQKLNFLTHAKLRASWGRLGYDAIGNFQSLSTFSFSDFVIFQGNDIRKTISSDGLPNESITWEKMDIINFGIDASFWEGKLEGSFDIYKRNRFDVLGQRLLEVPPIVGADLPLQNFQEFENRGFEFSLQHSNTIGGDWSYSIGGNFGINEEKVVHTDEVDFINKEVERREKQIGRRSPGTTVNVYGGFSGQQWYYETNGLFSSQEEIDNWADIDGNGNRSLQIGDVKVIDRNGDGRITNDDKYIASSGTTPRMIFGFQTRLAWKGLELISFWQGASRFGWNLTWSEYEAPFPGNGVALQKDLHDSYIPANEFGLPTNGADARWPRASGIIDGDYDTYLIDGTYLRLKQLQLGYTIPSAMIQKIGLTNLKVYVGGTNLLTFSDLDFFDPEIDENPQQFFGNYHPQTKVWNFGLQIDF